MKFFLLLITLFPLSCSLFEDKSNRIDIPYRIVYTDAQVDSIKDDFMKNGTEDNYASLASAYFHRGVIDDKLYYSIIGANRDGIPQACYDAYSILSNYSHFDSIDDETRELALMFLKKGADKMHSQSLQVLSDYYKEGRYIEKNETLATELRMRYDSITAANKERYRLEQEQEQEQ